MKLIAGLGNPGREYEKTRHNSGFLALDRLAEKCGVTHWSAKFEALTAEVFVSGQKVLLMKPQTYMNESGRAVSQAYAFYHLQPDEVLILHDDMDLPVGSLRIRTRGSSGGQKGMQSIINALGTDQLCRIRIGVGHSQPGEHDLVPDWVLSPVPASEQETYQKVLNQAAEAAYAWIDQPLEKVMAYNIREHRAQKSEE